MQKYIKHSKIETKNKKEVYKKNKAEKKFIQKQIFYFIYVVFLIFIFVYHIY